MSSGENEELTAAECQALLLARNGESIHLHEIEANLDHYRERVRYLDPTCDVCGAGNANIGCPNGKQICQTCFDAGFDGDTMPGGDV
jgi:hypothetical protein